MPSKPSGDRELTGRARKALDEWDGPGAKPTSEADLFRAYNVHLDVVKRPVQPVYDESGLLYGEPISEGRTVRQGRSNE